MKRSSLMGLLGSVLILSTSCVSGGGSSPRPGNGTPPPAPTAAPPATPTATLPAPIRTDSTASNWRLVFDDEFNGPKLDPDKWNPELQWGPVNPPELQYYTPDALQTEDGILRISAEKRGMAGKDYTSGAINTFWHFWFTYGYAEIRVRLPAGKGLWPGFWLLAHDTNSANEIDVFELRGQEPQVVQATLHYGPDKINDETDTVYRGPDFSQGFHTFAVRWEPSMIIWYVDGTEIFRVTEHVPHEPMYVIANLAVGGEWPGDPNAGTVFPAHMEVDYVRVYQHN